MLPATASRAGRAVAGTDTVPLWSAELPRGGQPRRRPAPVGEPDAVYLPACVNAMFGPAGNGPGVQDSVEKLCELAGVTLLIPSDVYALCCGTPWSSKGMEIGYQTMREGTATAIVAMLK